MVVVALWLLRSLVVGGLLLLVAAVAVAVVRQPVRRKQIALWATRAALLAPVLTLVPSWIRVTLPERTIPLVVADKQSALSTPGPSPMPATSLAVQPPSPQPSPPETGGEGVRTTTPINPTGYATAGVGTQSAIAPPFFPPLPPLRGERDGMRGVAPATTPSPIANSASVFATFSPAAL